MAFQRIHPVSRARRFPILLTALAVFGGAAAGNVRATEILVPGHQPTLAEALAVAAGGDIITLAPGQHSAAGLRVAVGVTIRGVGASPEATFVTAGGQGRILLIESVADTTVVQNLTLSGGLAAGGTNQDRSGGAVLVHSSPAVFRDVVFTDNEAAGHGGALRAVLCSPLIERCRFLGNRAPVGGGGAIEASFWADPSIIDCEFVGNSADWGGALAVREGAGASISGGRLVRNVAVGSLGIGGGVFVDTGGVVGLSDAIVARNEAVTGGGLVCLAGSLLNLDHVTVVDNVATGDGGGLLIAGSAPWLTASIVAFNIGTGISLADNAGPVIDCTDIYGNTGGDWTPELVAIADPQANFDVDPLFCSRDPLSDEGLRLADSSPLVQADKSCGIPGAVAETCGDAPTPVPPPLRPGLVDVGAWPNPFNPRTTVAFTLERAQPVDVAVYDARGRRVRRLRSGDLPAGRHGFPWDGRDQSGRRLGSGLYFVRLVGPDSAQTLKITMVK